MIAKWAYAEKNLDVFFEIKKVKEGVDICITNINESSTEICVATLKKDDIKEIIEYLTTCLKDTI